MFVVSMHVQVWKVVTATTVASLRALRPRTLTQGATKDNPGLHGVIDTQRLPYTIDPSMFGAGMALDDERRGSSSRLGARRERSSYAT